MTQPPSYASVMNQADPQQEKLLYNGQYPMVPQHHHQPVPQLHAPPPIIMNQVAPAPASTAAPTNIVVSTNANGGGGGGGGSSGGNHVAAYALGGFECPFCHLGVVKRRRNPLIKVFVVIVAVVTFPVGILACALCWTPCAYQSQCSTCKKKI